MAPSCAGCQASSMLHCAACMHATDARSVSAAMRNQCGSAGESKQPGLSSAFMQPPLACDVFSLVMVDSAPGAHNLCPADPGGPFVMGDLAELLLTMPEAEDANCK